MLLGAIRALPRAITSAFTITNQFFLPGMIDHSVLVRTIYNAQILRSTVYYDFFTSLNEIIIYLVVGLYLLRGGSFLFKMICPPDEP